MNFLDCIETAVANGKVSQEKADNAAAAYQRQYDDQIAQGTAKNLAESKAALSAVKETATLTSQKRWERVFEMRIAHQLTTDINATKNIGDLQTYLEQQANKLEDTYHRTLGQALSYISDNLEKYRPKAVGLINPIDDMDEIVDVAFGGKGNKAAQELYKEITAADEFLRKQSNARGASIPENKDRRLAQIHDRMKLKRIAPTVEASRTKWVNDHIDTLDWELMRYAGKEILPSEREEVLGTVFDAIITNGYSRITPGHTTGTALATRMNRERFLYYKDAESWKTMNKRYGSGNVFSQTLQVLDSASRDISLLENYGPNANVMKKQQSNLAQKRAADFETKAGTSKKRSATGLVDEALDLFDRRYALSARTVVLGEENMAAQTIATMRTAVGAVVLQGAFIFNLGDIGFMKDASRLNGLPANNIIRQYVKDFVPNKENRMWAAQSGIILESAIGQALSTNRFFGPMMGHQIARRFSDTMFRATWLTHHNQTAKIAWSKHLMGSFAMYRGKTLDKLEPNFKAALERNGITPEDWDHFRKGPVEKFRGAEFLRPIDLWNKGSVRDKEVADKFMDFMYDTNKRAVPEQGTRVQAALGGSISRASGVGMAAQTLSMLKGFPLTMLLVHMKDNWRLQTPGQRLVATTRLFAYMTVAGAAVTQLRELANGKDPRDMTDPRFWAEAAVNGGSLGLLGDTFGSFLRGHNVSDAVGSPILDFVDKTSQLTIGNLLELARGEETRFGKEFSQYLSSYMPTGWQLRLLFRHALANQLMKETDPAAFRRMVQGKEQRAREVNQKYWWNPGDQTPQNAPDLGAALGG